MINWNDIKYFLAMAETGSLSAAADKLKVSQPTLSRRLTTLEDEVGADLFSRTRTGLELTTIGEQLLDHARHMQDDMYSIERLLTGQDQALRGSVVISAIEHVASDWMVEKLVPFHEQYPSITIEIKTASAPADLLRREADIAIRMFRPEQNDLIARKTAVMNYGLYASKDYIATHGMPMSLQDLRHHAAILPHDEILAHVKSTPIKRELISKHAVFRSNSINALEKAVKAGYGIGSVSCFSASADENLVRVLEDINIFSTDIWVVSHAELKRSARIRAMFDFLADMFITHKAAFAG